MARKNRKVELLCWQGTEIRTKNTWSNRRKISGGIRALDLQRNSVTEKDASNSSDAAQRRRKKKGKIAAEEGGSGRHMEFTVGKRGKKLKRGHNLRVSPDANDRRIHQRRRREGTEQNQFSTR